MKNIFKGSLAILLALITVFSALACTTKIENSDNKAPDTTTAPTDTTAAPCEHEYVETISVSPLALKDGEKLITCKKCQNSYSEAIPMTKTLKILAIGNSFSSDAVEYLWNICSDGGVETIVIGNLYIGGCTLDKHNENIRKNSATYTYYKNTAGSWSSTSNTAAITAFQQENWDIITVQQASGSSGMPNTYSKLENILNIVTEKNPNASIYWHMTWSYQQNSTHNEFSNYSKDQMTMYKAIVNATQNKVLVNDTIKGCIPSGTAIQNLRSSYVGDTVTRDGYHMSYDIGRYTVALTWFAYLTGGDVTGIDWVPSAHSAVVSKNLEVIKESVKNALATPFEVTASAMKEDPNPSTPQQTTDEALFKAKGLDINNYTVFDWTPKVAAYYNSKNGIGLVHAGNSTASNIPNFIASRIITKQELPVGTIIIVDQGYTYRPEGWTDDNYKATTRPGAVSTNFVVVDNNWWVSFTLRGFNLGHSPAKIMTESDASHLRIYVPKN